MKELENVLQLPMVKIEFSLFVKALNSFINRFFVKASSRI